MKQRHYLTHPRRLTLPAKRNLDLWLAAPRMTRRLTYQNSRCGRIIRLQVTHEHRGTEVFIHRHKLRLQPLSWRVFIARLIRDLRNQLREQLRTENENNNADLLGMHRNP